jgi:hypothetical protein
MRQVATEATLSVACSPNLNVELSNSLHCDDNYMDGDDYYVVMAC